MAEVMNRYPAVARFQAVITRREQQDHLTYIVELHPNATLEPGLAERLAEALRESVKVRGEVQLAPAGTLAADAKRIDDLRVWK